MHTSTKQLLCAALTGWLTLGLSACAGTPPKPITTVAKVDLKRFMGDWYVIANIPTFIEKGAHNAIESYAMNPDGSDQIIEAKGEAYGTNIWTRTYRGSSSYSGVRRTGWSS